MRSIAKPRARKIENLLFYLFRTQGDASSAYHKEGEENEYEVFIFWANAGASFAYYTKLKSYFLIIFSRENSVFNQESYILEYLDFLLKFIFHEAVLQK